MSSRACMCARGDGERVPAGKDAEPQPTLKPPAHPFQPSTQPQQRQPRTAQCASSASPPPPPPSRPVASAWRRRASSCWCRVTAASSATRGATVAVYRSSNRSCMGGGGVPGVVGGVQQQGVAGHGHTPSSRDRGAAACVRPHAPPPPCAGPPLWPPPTCSVLAMTCTSLPGLLYRRALSNTRRTSARKSSGWRYPPPSMRLGVVEKRRGQGPQTASACPPPTWPAICNQPGIASGVQRNPAARTLPLTA